MGQAGRGMAGATEEAGSGSSGGGGRLCCSEVR